MVSLVVGAPTDDDAVLEGKEHKRDVLHPRLKVGLGIDRPGRGKVGERFEDAGRGAGCVGEERQEGWQRKEGCN